MQWEIMLLATVLGYLVGSVSFSRIILAIVSPGSDLSQTAIPSPVGREDTNTDVVSATIVSVRVGPRYGFLTMLGDMAKIIVPTLVIKLVYAPEPYHLITALAGMLGHIWPLYHRFKGGRGLTVIWGSMIVIDWMGMLVTSISGMMIGTWVVRRLFAVYTTGPALMIPWLWFRFKDWRYVLYAVLANALFYLSTLKEIRSVREVEGLTPQDALIEGLQISSMGRGILKLSRRLGIFPNVDTNQVSGT